MPRTSFPTYLQSLHQFRPTKPSHGFSGTGLGRFKPQGLKTHGSFQTYLLFTMYSEQASVLSRTMQTFISSEGYSRATHQNRVPRLVELSGIEPLTPACKAGALPAELQPQPSQTPDSKTAVDQVNSANQWWAGKT